jgi:hypothetical protein
LKTCFLIDTGSTISLINKDTWEQLEKHEPGIRLEKGVKRAIAANNQPIRTLGVAFLKIKMDDEVFIQKFVVTADTQCLLGMDYLQQNIKSINLTQRTLEHCKGKSHTIQPKIERDDKIRVVCLEDIRLKPRHKTIITAKIIDSDIKGEVVIEPALIISEKTGVMIARVLVDVPTSREVPIQLTNPADKTIVIYKDQTIGFVHHISEENEQVNQIHDNATEELVDNMISNARTVSSFI